MTKHSFVALKHGYQRPCIGACLVGSTFFGKVVEVAEHLLEQDRTKPVSICSHFTKNFCFEATLTADFSWLELEARGGLRTHFLRTAACASALFSRPTCARNCTHHVRPLANLKSSRDENAV